MTTNQLSEQESLDQYIGRMTLRFAIGTGIIVGLVVLLANFNRNPVPMVGDGQAFGTLAFFSTTLIALGAGVVAFVLGIRSWNERVAVHRQRGWKLAVLPIAIAYTLMVAAAFILALQFIEFAFRDLRLATFQGVFLAGLASSVIIQWLVGRIMRISSSDLFVSILLIVGTGVYLTAAVIDDPLWWEISFSYLGTINSNANAIFNFTLVFAALLLIAWLPYFMSDFRILVHHGLAPERSIRLIQIALLWLAIGIGFVGFFKSGLTPFSSLMHNLSAYSLAAILGLLMAGVQWLVPGFAREIFATSWALVAVLVATLLLAAFGYFNTVGLEIIAFALGLTWLSMFVRNTESTAAELEPSAFPN